MQRIRRLGGNRRYLFESEYSWTEQRPQAAATVSSILDGGRRALKHPTPQAQKLPIAPILKANSITLVVSREKDGKLRLVYVGWDDVKVVLLGTSPLAEGQRPIHDQGVLTPYGSSMATPLSPWLCQTRTRRGRPCGYRVALAG
jgi:hypothetical protein